MRVSKEDGGFFESEDSTIIYSNSAMEDQKNIISVQTWRRCIIIPAGYAQWHLEVSVILFDRTAAMGCF